MIIEGTTVNDVLPKLMRELLTYGVDTPSRNGDTKELLNCQVVLSDPWSPYITIPERKASVAAQIAETAWILAGRNDVEWLSRYLPRAADFSDDGETWRGGYGPRIRSWYVGETPQVSGAYTIDQLAHVIHLLRAEPGTRRAIINIYDPAVDVDPGKDIPCNNWLHFIHRDGRLNLTVATRSNDAMWGWSGINAFEWTILLQVVAREAMLEPGSITFNITSLHLYAPYYEKAERISETTPLWSTDRTTPRVLRSGEKGYVPEKAYTAENGLYLDRILPEFFKLEKKMRSLDELPRADKMAKADKIATRIAEFPEPLFKSWLYALLSWNLGEIHIERAEVGVCPWGLRTAYEHTPKRKMPEEVAPTVSITFERAPSAFLEFVQELHAEKDAAYGDSWCRRGEQMGIMANIARKVDRLGVAGAGDTASDTALDMAVYLVKYSIWYRCRSFRSDRLPAFTGPEHVHAVNAALTYLDERSDSAAAKTTEELVSLIKVRFAQLEKRVVDDALRGFHIASLSRWSWLLARQLWLQEREEAAKKVKWAADNATRAFNGYALTEGEDAK